MTHRLGLLRAARLLLVDENTGRARQLMDNPLFAESDAPQLSNPAYYPIEHLRWLRSGLLVQRRWGHGMDLLYVPLPPR